MVLPTWLSSTKVSSLIERISDPKDLKKLLRTRNNVLVLYSESGKWSLQTYQGAVGRRGESTRGGASILHSL